MTSGSNRAGVDGPINLAVVGCGYWGPNLIRNFRSTEGCQVSFACDRDEKRLESMRTRYPEVQTVADFDSLIQDDDLDAIVIATPVRLHHEFARRSLLAGKHVLVEKPLAGSVAECEELIQLANDAGLCLMVGHTFVYTAAVRKIKQIIDSGSIGEVFYIASRRLNLGLFQQDINVTWDLAPHDLSIILYLSGERPISVNCQGKAHITAGIEDVTNLTLEMPNGGFAAVHSSWLDPRKVRETTIVGSSGMIVYDDTEPIEKIRVYDKRVEAPPHYETFGEFQYSYHYGDMWSPHLDQLEPLGVQCRHFLDCIRSGERPDSCGRDGLRVVEILEAASASLADGGRKVMLRKGPVSTRRLFEARVSGSESSG